MASTGVLAAIGNTPLVELQRLPAAGSARIVVKLESANPTGSMKDRVARAMIEAAITARRRSVSAVHTARSRGGRSAPTPPSR